MLRLHVPLPLLADQEMRLPDAAARHVQVRRLQPGAELRLFDGSGGQWLARVLSMGRSEVVVRVDVHEPGDLDAPRPVHLAVGMPANERMDWLVEKAGELGAASLTPLLCERSVLRLEGERARRRRDHWQSVAVAAAEQCGATRLLVVQPVQELGSWLQRAGDEPMASCVLSLAAQAQAHWRPPPGQGVRVLSGPEGGLTPAEEARAAVAGFVSVSLGARTLRAETAPLVALARWLD
jgi:16S rRNA (uracil1498-N3)-methyltransferase